MTAFDLAIVAERSPSGASHVLGLLRANCAVKVRKVGKYSYYSLKDVRTDRLLDSIFK